MPAAGVAAALRDEVKLARAMFAAGVAAALSLSRLTLF